MASKTCKNCGEYYSSTAAFCPSCGEANSEYRVNRKEETTSVSSYTENSTYSPNHSTQTPIEGDTTIYAVIGFFFWFVGLILYLALKDSRPKAAQSALNGSLTIIVLGIIIAVLANL
jgi:uncharacterized membrane protein YvbJ